MPRNEVVFPFGGRLDSASHTDRPELYTRAAQNVRGRDPETGEMRGSRRAALTKWNESAIGTGSFKALCSTTFDTRHIAYTGVPDSPVYDSWSGLTTDPFGETTFGIGLVGRTDIVEARTDTEGNLYFVDSASTLVKYNSSGREVFRFRLPVADPMHVVRALYVDDRFRIFAGVSEGGNPNTARMWCILQEPQEERDQADETEYYVLWTYEPGGYTESLRIFNGSQLYAAHNFPDELRSRIVVYEDIVLLPRPGTTMESVPYPLHDMDIGPDGAAYFTSPAQDTTGYEDGEQDPIAGFMRRGFPGSPNTHASVVGWTPNDLSDAKKRIWSWYKAEDIDDTDLAPEESGLDNKAFATFRRIAVATTGDRTRDVVNRALHRQANVANNVNNARPLSREEQDLLASGREILRWRDSSGNGRHLYSGARTSGDSENGPIYRRRGLGGLPSVHFINAVLGDPNGQHVDVASSLISDQNQSTAAALADSQRTPFPLYTDSMWAAFILLRPSLGGVQSSGDVDSSRVLLTIRNSGSGGEHRIWINRDCAASEDPSTQFAAGYVSWHAATDSGDPGGCAGGTNLPVGVDWGSIDRETGCLLLTLIWDGGVDPNDTSKTRCILRVNGQPYDRFEGLPLSTTGAVEIGIDTNAYTAVGARYAGEICEMLVLDRKNRFTLDEPKIATHDHYEAADTTAQTDNEIAQIEAYMLGKRGCLNVLVRDDDDLEHFYGASNRSGNESGEVPTVPTPVSGGRSTAYEALLRADAQVGKLDPGGALKWVAGPRYLTTQGGIGYGVRVRRVVNETAVWCTGLKEGAAVIWDPSPPAASTVALRKLIDSGSNFSQVSDSWTHTFSGNAEPDYAYPRMGTDKFGVLYYPNTNGNVLLWHAFLLADDGGNLAQEIGDGALTSSTYIGRAVAVQPDSMVPDYHGDLTDETAQYFYVVGKAGSAAHLWKVQIVNAAVLSGLPREVVTLAAVGTDVRIVTTSTDTVPTGGSGVLDDNASFVSCVRTRDHIILLDGVSYLAYSLKDGTVATLAPTSSGEIPPYARIGMFWRHRLVIGRFSDNAGGYAASAVGNIFDWNFRPAFFTATQAFRGPVTRAGEAEDALVAMIPVWDDLAYLICENKILRLTGDPMDGGVIHKVTDQLGGVLGDSWCVDALGRVFIFGNRPPGLYQLQPVGDPIPLSRHTLEESEFADIDFSTHRIMLVWNPIDRGVHIFQVALSSATVVSHWFWEEKTHRLVNSPPLWTDKFYSADKQPRVATYIGGDASRMVLFGCEDGYIRKWDPTANTDDGDPVDAFVTMRVSPRGPPSAEWLLREVQIALADSKGGANLEVFSSETADTLGAIQHSLELGPGLNEAERVRIRGNHIWLRIRSAAAERWAYESGACVIEARGSQVPMRSIG